MTLILPASLAQIQKRDLDMEELYWTTLLIGSLLPDVDRDWLPV